MTPPHLAGPAFAVALAASISAGCAKGPPTPRHRERVTARDANCREPARPSAYMYPAENRSDYGPDDPRADGCVISVPDHLFCCPAAARATDR